MFWTDDCIKSYRNCIEQVQLKSCDPRLLHTNQKWRLIAEYMCSHICSHALIWTSGTGGPSESEGLSRTARWNMWAVIVRIEEKQSNAEGGIPVLTECRHHRGAPLFTFILSPVLYLFFFPSAQHFPSHCIRRRFSGLLRTGSRQHVAAGVSATEETWAQWSL